MGAKYCGKRGFVQRGREGGRGGERAYLLLTNMTKVRYEEEGAERKDKKEEKMAIWRCPVDSEGGAGQSGRGGSPW